MSENYINPIERGPVSAAGVTASEGARGAVTGGLMGLIKGPIYGLLGGFAALALPTAAILAIPTAIIGGGALIFGASLVGVATTAAYVVGGGALITGTIGGLSGLLGGTIVGGPLGALFGGLRGAGHGREILDHERGAAQLLEAQNNALQTQAAVASALQAQAQRPVIIQPASAPVVAPGFTVTNMAHQGQGMGASMPQQVAANDTANLTHTQQVDADRAAMASNAPARA